MPQMTLLDGFLTEQADVKNTGLAKDRHLWSASSGEAGVTSSGCQSMHQKMTYLLEIQIKHIAFSILWLFVLSH